VAEILERSGYRVKIKVEVSASDVEKAYQSVLSGYSQNVKLSGFRQGKAPAKVIESKIGREALLEDVKEKLLDDSYPKAVKELQLAPVGVKLVEANLLYGQPFVYVAEVENYPEVKLPDWEGFNLESQAQEVTQELVDKALEELRQRYGELIPVERPIEDKDQVYIETDDGGRFPVNMENAQPHVREVLLGKSMGEEVKVPVKDGEEIVREIPTKILEVKGVQLPELDDEFAKTAGEETLEALTTRVGESLKGQFEREARNQKANQLLDKLAEDLQAEIPPSMQASSEQDLLQSLAQDLKQQNNIELREYIEDLEKQDKLEEFKQNLSKSATTRLRRSLAVEALADQLKTELSEEEWNAYLADLARAYRSTPSRLQNELGQETLQRLRVQRVHDKALFQAIDKLEAK